MLHYSLAIGLALTAASAQADLTLNLEREPLRAEFTAGECRYGRPPDGMFWQADRNNQNIYKDSCFKAGISGALNDKARWFVGYVDLGKVSTRAAAVVTNNDDYANRDYSKDLQRKECIENFNADNCEYLFMGRGGMAGLEFSLSAEILKVAGFSLEAKVGMLLYHATFNASVSPLSCPAAGCPWRVGIQQSVGDFISPMFGAVVRIGPFYAGTDIYIRSSEHLPMSAGYKGYVQMTQIGIAKEF